MWRPPAGPFDSAHPVGAFQPSGEGVAVEHSCSHQSVPEYEQIRGRQNGCQVEERLLSCRHAETAMVRYVDVE
ncbi:MAG: hypothetical protein JWP11_595 [Frankiales bacterium]|nr:hypothetical protein [Frankiales bacterium]